MLLDDRYHVLPSAVFLSLFPNYIHFSIPHASLKKKRKPSIAPTHCKKG